MDALRELILRGEFATRARLGEAELATRLGVTRTHVRDALTRLAAEGLVEFVPNHQTLAPTTHVEIVDALPCPQ